MKKKLSLSKLSENAICKEEQKDVKGGHVSAACWSAYERSGKVGGAANEQFLNHLDGGFWEFLFA